MVSHSAMSGVVHLSASQQWPPNLPNPVTHPTILVLGLSAWIKSLDPAMQAVMCGFLLDWDVREGTPDLSLFQSPKPTLKLAQAYDMSGELARKAFVDIVIWRGLADIPPETPFPPPDKPLAGYGAFSVSSDPGNFGLDSDGGPPDQYCYRLLFTTAGFAAAEGVLGPNPWGPKLAGYLLEHAGVWSPDKFALEVGFVAGTSSSMAYVQAHVKPGCLSVRQLLPFFTGAIRVGAQLSDLNAILNLNATDEAPSHKTVYDRKPSGESRTIDVGVYAIVGGDKATMPNFTWTVFSTPFLVATLGIYESVRLESANFVIKLDSGSDNKAYYGIGPASGEAPKTRADWLRLPVSSIMDGSDSGSVAGTLSLPDDHPFNPEMRYATTFGTSAPVFYFAFSGNVDHKATIVGKIRVRVAGLAPFGKVNMGGSAGTKARDLKSHTRTIQREAGMLNLVAPDVDAEDESDEDSDAEAEAVVPLPPAGRRSSPQNRP